MLSTNLMAEQNLASWYGKNHHGKKTASGEIFNMYVMTAAHRHIKLGSKVKVTNLKNQKSVIVKITDRGPFVKNRIIDLSWAAAKQIDIKGTAPVRLEILN
jgi:rare lipoprotein A